MSNSESADRRRFAIFVGLLVAFAIGAFFQTRVGGSASPTPLPTYTPPPTSTPYPTHTPYPTYTPLPTETPTLTLTLTHTPSSTPTSTSTATPTMTSTPTDTPTSTPTFTPLPTHTPYPTYTPLPSATPTDTPTTTPTDTPTATPTDTPTTTPTDTPTATPTDTPTTTPTDTPTATPTNTPTSTATITPIPPRIILSGIQTLGKLITIEKEIAIVDIQVRDPAPLGCAYTAQHLARGVIEVGIDLTAFDEDSIHRNFVGLPVKITAPSPVISSCRIEFFRQYDKQGGGTASCFANNWDAMSDIGRHLAMKEFLVEAQTEEIMERAQNQAALVLRSFISDLIGSRVEIEFEDAPEEPIIPQSCEIDPPANWEIRDDQSGWRRSS